MKKTKIKKEKCTACDGFAYFPSLFENNRKCPHCDENGNTLIIKEIKSKKHENKQK